MPRYDHEIKVGNETLGLTLARDEQGKALYHINENVPQYRNPLIFSQSSFMGGHGQHTFREPDKFYSGRSIDITKDGRLVLGPLITEVKESDDTVLDSAPVCFAWFAATGELLCATSGKIYRYDVGSNAKWTAATTTVANVTDMVEYNGVMFAVRGSSNTYYYSTDGDTWTLSTLDVKTFSGLLNAPNAAGTANVLWAFKTPNEVYSNTSGINGGAQWSSAAYIGDTSNNIVRMFLSGDKILIGRTDNLYWYDADGGVHPLMDDLKHNRTTRNFQYYTNWQGIAYFTIGDGIGELNQNDQFDVVGPLELVDDIGKSGNCVGLSNDKDWVYAAYDEGTDTIIYKGRERWLGDRLRWEWFPFVYLGTNTCATIKVVQHSATDRRLWFGYGASGTTTGYVELWEDPTNSSANFASSGWLRMSYEYGTNPGWDKMFQKVRTETSGCSTSVYVTPYYLKDTDTSATQLTRNIEDNGMVETYLDREISCNRIQFQLNLTTGSSSSTPEVLNFEAHGIENPEFLKVYDVVYVAGTSPKVLTKTIWNFFNDARESNSLIRLADIRYGESTTSRELKYHWVRVVPGYPQPYEVYHSKGKQPELGIQVRLQEVDMWKS